MSQSAADPTANAEAVGKALTALGEAWRGDWSEFDGRTLRAQLNELAGFLKPDAAPFDYLQWAQRTNVCPVERCWPEHCSKMQSYDWCDHMDEGGEAR